MKINNIFQKITNIMVWTLITFLVIFGVSYGAGWHIADEILSGNFRGDYNFTGSIEKINYSQNTNVGKTARLGRMTSTDNNAGYGSYIYGGNSPQFDCSSTKGSGYCVALYSGPFISQFTNPIKKKCYWHLYVNGAINYPYSINTDISSGSSTIIGGYVNKGELVGWFRNTDPYYNGDCSNTISVGFTLISLS